MLTEPTILTAKLAGCLRGGGWKVKIRNDTDDTGESTFESEKPALDESVREVVAKIDTRLTQPAIPLRPLSLRIPKARNAATMLVP